MNDVEVRRSPGKHDNNDVSEAADNADKVLTQSQGVICYTGNIAAIIPNTPILPSTILMSSEGSSSVKDSPKVKHKPGNIHKPWNRYRNRRRKNAILASYGTSTNNIISSKVNRRKYPGHGHQTHPSVLLESLQKFPISLETNISQGFGDFLQGIQNRTEGKNIRQINTSNSSSSLSSQIINSNQALTEITRDDDLHVIIVDSSTGAKLSSNMWNTVEQRLIEMVCDYMLTKKNGPVVRYDSSEMIKGHRVIKCEDYASREFLCWCVTRLNWEGIIVKLISVRNIPKTIKAYVGIPKIKITEKQLLKFLQMYNPEIPMIEWRAVKIKDSGAECINILLLIPEESVDALQKSPAVKIRRTTMTDSPTSTLLVEDPKELAMDACFTAFDKDGDDRLSLAEFTLICRALFRNDKGHIYDVSQDRLEQMFAVFDKNGDGFIDREEFQFCWNQWIKTIVRPVNALIIVDVQNDFISGSLNISNCSAQHNGLEIIDPINNLLDTVDFDAVFYSLDWHPRDHVSFIDNVKMRPLDESSPVDADSAQVYDTVIFAGPSPMKQRLWPRHCVQDSWGAELHKDLKVVDHGIKVYKGTNPEVDSYSVFWDNKKLSDTTLNAQLKMKGTTDIYVCGLAYDVCVGATAVDALSAGYRTILIDDCCRGVDLIDIENTKEKVNSSFGVIIHSNEVKGMVEGRDRRPELGYKLAMELKNPDSVLSQRNGMRKSI